MIIMALINFILEPFAQAYRTTMKEYVQYKSEKLNMYACMYNNGKDKIK